MSRTVMVVAAHPDDEILGCGATMAWHADQGDAVHILIVADGETSREDAVALDRRNEAASRAAAVVGARPPRMLGLPDNRLDQMALLDIIKPIEACLAEVQPQLIYTHHGCDLNIDHALTQRAVLTACRPLPGKTVEAIYCFEVPSSSEWAVPSQSVFRPTHFVNIERTAERKLAALRCYEAEMRPFPHPRSYEAIHALAQWRGASCGLRVAEAFEPARTLIR